VASAAAPTASAEVRAAEADRAVEGRVAKRDPKASADHRESRGSAANKAAKAIQATRVARVRMARRDRAAQTDPTATREIRDHRAKTAVRDEWVWSAKRAFRENAVRKATAAARETPETRALRETAVSKGPSARKASTVHKDTRDPTATVVRRERRGDEDPMEPRAAKDARVERDATAHRARTE